MAVTETTTQSWFSRLGDSFKGIVTGLILVVASVVLLFWNEGRTLHRYQDLAGAAEACVPVTIDSVNPENNGKPVYLTGEMKTEEVLTDSAFPAVSVNGLKLRRTVEMYQWQENESTKTQKKIGGSEETVTTYSYSKVWSEQPIDSSSFKEAGHDNPASMDLESEENDATTATIGVFNAAALIPLKNDSKTFVVKTPEEKAKEATAAENAAPVEDSAPAPAENASPAEEKPAESTATAGTEETVSAAPAEVTVEEAVEAPAEVKAEETVETPAEVKAEEKTEAKTETKDADLPEGFQYFNKGYYRGKNPAIPEIGDLKVSFEYVPNGNVSVVAGQQDDQLIEWQSKNGTVVLLKPGTIAQDKMFADAQQANKTMGWILRGIGAFLMFIGFNMIFKPLSVIADVLPILGNLVGGATGIVAFILALSGSCLTIGIAWLYYRPLIGVPLVIAAILLFFWAFAFGKKKN
ncbi:MAG: TMEM43 family protein [Thermoguttaceae bacterium]|nr:TMEM43 family protein [Thermoguttaceae bacterium]